jgi:predicted acylesterase/phospholipase RssA
MSDVSQIEIVPEPATAELFFAECELLGLLDRSALSIVRKHLSWKRVAGQAPLIIEGELAHSVFFVHSGTFRAIGRDQFGNEVVWREHQRGDVIGELGVLASTRRTASVVAVRDSLVASIDHVVFLDLLAHHPAIGLALSRVLGSRLMNRTPPPGRFRFVAVVPIDPFPQTSDALHSNAQGSLTRADAQTGVWWREFVQSIAFAAGGVLVRGREALGGALAAHENSKNTVLIDASDVVGGELEQLLRQVDRIVCVVDAAGKLNPRNEVAILVRGLVAQTTGPDAVCVIVQPSRVSMPVGTTAKLAQVGAISHHHIRADRLEDCGPVGRSLAGTDISLVFGGGGARGGAHVGVVRACEQLGLNADRIGGTSMGAIVGSAHAMGLDSTAMLELLKQFAVSGAMRQVSVPTVSLLGVKKLEAVFDAMYGTSHLDDFWRPFFCTSVNLTTGNLDVHHSGPATTWVRASGAVPGVFPPVVGPEGSLHIDGGLLNNLPSDLMRDTTRGRIILVDVAAASSTVSVDPTNVPPLGWRDVAARVRKQPTFPSLLTTMQRGTLLTSAQQRQNAIEAADLLLEPPLAEFGLFDFGSIEEIAERGYRTAMEVLPSWLENAQRP